MRRHGTVEAWAEWGGWAEWAAAWAEAGSLPIATTPSAAKSGIALAANPKYLRIDQRSDHIVVSDDSDHAQTFYPDGKKHDDKDADGKKFSTKASWEGGALVAETKLPHSEKLTQTFRVSEDGKQLSVITRFEAPSLGGPVSIRRVYDVPKSPAK